MSQYAPATAPGPIGLTIRALVGLYIGGLVALPLATLLQKGVAEGLLEIWEAATSPVAADAIIRTLWTAGLTAAINAVLGTATAWVLVRYRFPGRTFVSALIDLPFAIPTLVTGVMLVVLFGPQEPLGRRLAESGFPLAFAEPGIVLALLFVTLPFVVRAVEPVLLELDPAEEEAAQTLGAGPWRIFRRVILPALRPAIAYGVVQSFARAIGEFGAIVVVSGNIPFQTLTAPVQIFSEVESGRPEVAAALSVALLGIALGLALVARGLRRLGGLHA